MSAIIEGKNITKAYRVYRKRLIGYEEVHNTLALENVNFTVPRGEFVSLIGPSGCGKTTLLRIFAGLIKHDSGEALINGKPVSGPPPNIGMVFQNIGLLPWRTAQKNVELAFELRHHHPASAEEKAKATEYLSKVGLVGFEDSYPYQLSGGMQQRVGLARALVTEPEILLADEPFGAIDAQTRLILQDEMLRLFYGRGITVLFVTHDLDEAVYLSDRVIILTRRPGKIKQIFSIPLERPRYKYDVRSTDQFISMKSKVWQSLREEILETQAGVA